MYRIYDWLLCRTIGLAILLFFGFLAPMTLLAQETLNYTGTALTGSFGQFTTLEPTLDVTSISGDVVLAQALNPNQANQIVTPASFNFGVLLNSTLGYVDASSFSFSTKNGQVVGWSINLNADTTDAGSTLTSTAAGDHYTANEVSSICFHDGGVGCSNYSASNAQGGVWVDPPSIKSTVQAPELDYKTASSALVLLLSGVAILSSRRRV